MRRRRASRWSVLSVAPPIADPSSFDRHNKAECPNPRIFKGTCRICDEEGHPAAQCPSKPPDVCRNCDEEGHIAKDCTNNRKLDRSDVEDKAPDDAWAAMKKADDERDMDDFKEVRE